MRIALYHHLPPGGALRSVTEVLRRLPEGVTCDVFTLDSRQAWVFGEPGQSTQIPDRPHEYKVDTGWLGNIAAGRFERLALINAVRKAERDVADVINASDYDAVLVHCCWVTQTPHILAHLQAPTIYYMHEPRRATFERNYAPRPRPREIRRLPRWLIGLGVERQLRREDIKAAAMPSLVLCNSYYSAEAIQRAYGITAAVTYLGVDEAIFSPDPALTRDPSVLSVGGFEEFKGQHIVVEALGLLKERDRPALRIAYERFDPVYRDRVRQLAARLGVTVEEYPGVDDRMLAQLYRRAAATVLAATLEPFGLTMLESMACGTPVVAFREGGYREVVQPGVNGILVDRSVEQLSCGIAQAVRLESLAPSEAIRASVLPFWTWTMAAERQVAAVARVARHAKPR